VGKISLFAPSPSPSHQKGGEFLFPLPWWERARERGQLLAART